MELNAQQQQEFEKFRNSNSMIFLQILIKDALDESIRDYVNKINHVTNESQLYTIKEICEMFEVTSATVHNWKKQGWLIGQRRGKSRYFTRDEVDRINRIHKQRYGN